MVTRTHAQTQFRLGFFLSGRLGRELMHRDLENWSTMTMMTVWFWYGGRSVMKYTRGVTMIFGVFVRGEACLWIVFVVLWPYQTLSMKIWTSGCLGSSVVTSSEVVGEFCECRGVPMVREVNLFLAGHWMGTITPWTPSISLSMPQVSVPTKHDSGKMHSSVDTSRGAEYMQERDSALAFYDLGQ